MSLECAQVILNSSDVLRARDFYVDRLGFSLVEEFPESFSFRAGAVRYTVTPGGRALGEDDPSNTTIIFRISNLEQAVKAYEAKGVVFLSEITLAPGFMKFITLLDPDNNPLMLGEYLKDPLIR